ncbi:MAG: hypothetical protein K0U64_11485 [Actinomycetia bacterium]|nr:hypothetical protein [Actinomycetes bacterium]
MSPRTRSKNWLILAFAAPLLLLLAACSSADESQVASIEAPDADPSASAGTQGVDDGGLAFAQCMRENGVDFPDPDPDGGFDSIIGAIDPTDPKFNEALQACNDLRPAGNPLDQSFDADAQAQVLELAKCMRENGIDVPDPSFDANGQPVDVDLSGLNFNDPDFREAIQECREFIDFGRGTP